MVTKPKTLAQFKAEKRGETVRASRDRAYEQHRSRDPAARARKAFYATAAWRRTRAAKLARDPICEECARDGRTNATKLHVHHVKEVADRPDLAHVLDNLETLCSGCHNRRHAAGRVSD